MMQANELMGNYFIGYDNKIFKWDLVHFDLLITAHCKIDEIIKEPIKISEEWMLKFGFEKSDHHSGGYRWSKGMFYVLELAKDCFYCDYTLIFSVDHIHQLQNLYFALTKQELTIV